MQRSLVLSLFSTACSQVDALSLHKRDAPAVVGFDIQRSEIDKQAISRSERRPSMCHSKMARPKTTCVCLLPLSRWTA